MFGVHEHQHSPEQVLVHDVGLDVVGVVLHAEGQQLQDQRQQLRRLEVVCKRSKVPSGWKRDGALGGAPIESESSLIPPCGPRVSS